ncbi:kinase-like domain-containing protein [Chaetomium sp. MPI-CAGE-AT-0009]|nr:kinase-like domain-containing protein [Chaetomium sp. MPI-CAGE-AT-0009]
MAPSDHDRRNDDPSQDFEDLLAAARSDDANAQGSDDPGPPAEQLDAIRGQGGTAANLLHAAHNVPGYSARPPRSIAETEVSRMTIGDRGDAHYVKACADGSHRPTVKTPDLPPSAPLSDRLMTLRVTSSRPKGSKFYPKGSVEALMTAEEIESVILQGREELEKAGKSVTDDEIKDYARRACLGDDTKSSYRVIFAILVLIQRGWDIVLFIDERICDKDLPLKAVPVTGPDAGSCSRMRRQNGPDIPLAWLDHWTGVDHEYFEQNQWSMLAPFFARSNRRNAWLYELPEKTVLPWIMEDNAARQGGYAFVSKVKIHPSHHTFNVTKENGDMFAVKHFKGRSPGKSGNGASDTSGKLSKEEFENEIEILNRFSGDVHPHLISLQAAFHHGDEYAVILPWAECDLAEYWQKTVPGPPLDKENLLWMLGQCRGLTDGLQQIHLYERTDSIGDPRPWTEKVYGRHGDIKPANILVFRDQSNPQGRGKLVITDFGLSRFHSDASKSCSSNMHIGATLTYRSPEFDLEGGVITRSSDIWSFGCVLLEFAAWYLGGWTLVTEFAEHRSVNNTRMHGYKVDQFFEMQPRARVHPRVSQFVDDKLHGHPSCSESIHHLLDFVMGNMLLVDSRGENGRAKCGKVLTELNELYETVADQSYHIVASPRSSPTPVMPDAAETSPISMRGSHLNDPSSRYPPRRTRNSWG